MKTATDWRPEQGRQSSTGSVVVAIALLVGWIVVAVFGAYNRIDALARRDALAAAEQLIWLTRIVAFVFNLGILAVGAWTLWTGYRICRAGRFPLPGMKLMRSVGECAGRKAQVIGSIAEVVGVLVLILGTTATWLFVDLSEVVLKR